MMSRQKMLALVLYGLAFLMVTTYFIGCFEVDNLRSKWMSSISSSDDSERALNYYRSSQWKTDKELAEESAPKHEHGTLCAMWLIAAIILPISAVGHSAVMFVRKMSRMKQRFMDILTQEQKHEPKDVVGKGKSTLGSFLNRPVRIKDEIAGGVIFLLLSKIVRLYRQRTRRGK